MKDFDENAIVASICPKHPSSPDPVNDPYYGYNPVMVALADRLGTNTDRRCLPRRLAAVDDPATPEVDPRVCCTIVSGARQSLKNYGMRGDDSLPSCDSFCICEIPQLQGADLATCQGEVSVPPEIRGYCYVDEAQGIGNPEIVSFCRRATARIIRFVGDDTPTKGALAFISCAGAPLGP